MPSTKWLAQLFVNRATAGTSFVIGLSRHDIASENSCSRSKQYLQGNWYLDRKICFRSTAHVVDLADDDVGSRCRSIVDSPPICDSVQIVPVVEWLFV